MRGGDVRRASKALRGIDTCCDVASSGASLRRKDEMGWIHTRCCSTDHLNLADHHGRKRGRVEGQ